MLDKPKYKRGFTLIELLVVISIIGILATIILVSLGSARAKARDVRRLTDMRNIITALEMYYDSIGQYPVSDYQGCGGWDTPGDGDFIDALTTSEYLNVNLKDPGGDDYDCGNYRYYRYTEGSYGCDANRGSYYVLGVVDMEGTGNPYPNSPGWNCSGRNWQGEMEWVTGRFEK